MHALQQKRQLAVGAVQTDRISTPLTTAERVKEHTPKKEGGWPHSYDSKPSLKDLCAAPNGIFHFQKPNGSHCVCAGGWVTVAMVQVVCQQRLSADCGNGAGGVLAESC
jgi:hypothetical protein